MNPTEKQTKGALLIACASLANIRGVGTLAENLTRKDAKAMTIIATKALADIDRLLFSIKA